MVLYVWNTWPDHEFFRMCTGVEFWFTARLIIFPILNLTCMWILVHCLIRYPFFPESCMRITAPASLDTKTDESIVLWNFPCHISFQQMGQCQSLQLCHTSTLFFNCISLYSAIIREANDAMYSVIWLPLPDARVTKKSMKKSYNSVVSPQYITVWGALFCQMFSKIKFQVRS